MVTVLVRIPATGDKPAFEKSFEVSLPGVTPITQACQEGETQTVTCLDGSQIVTAICRRDPATGINAFVPTGNVCPVPPIKQVCKIGDERTILCPDNSVIVSQRCEVDPTTNINRWVPTGNTCPPSELGKQIKILVYPAGASLEAYDGQEVTITASVTCGFSPSNGESAIFLVDGNEISRGTTEQGFVSFKWTATPEPSRTHKICVSVPKSSQCSQYGEARDCKTITVSRVIPGIEEQLKKEREAYLALLEGTRAERERIRQLTSIIPEGTQQPVITPTPIVIQPPTCPSGQVYDPVTQTCITPTTPTPPGPGTGIISVPSVKIPPGVEFPIEIYIDGQLIGAPPVYREVSAGTHSVRIQLKGFTPISLKVDVPAGGVKTIDESFL